jgi:hypothetical protein
MMMCRKTSVTFPTPTDLSVNMMPIIMGDLVSVPDPLRGYLPLINACDFEPGTTVYLTVQESQVASGASQRRGGIHTEGFNPDGLSELYGGGEWGGGWGGSKGIFMASSDGACRIWNQETHDVNHHGELRHDINLEEAIECEPSVLYWMTDRTPHQALPSKEEGYRQFFRLVSEDVSVWFSEHNSPNPTGVVPGCPVVTLNKFK